MSIKTENKAKLYEEISLHSKDVLNGARKMNLYIAMFEPNPRKTLDVARAQDDIATVELTLDRLKAALKNYSEL